MTTITKFKWIWAWDDDKEEAWLREMAQQGWHFKSFSSPASFIFEQGDPKDYVFRLDYFIDKKEEAYYLQLFKDAGWEHVGEMGGWQYFRKESINGEEPEIYSDNASKAMKYQRIIFFLVVMMPIFVINLKSLSKQTGTFFEVFTFITFCILVLFSYAIIRLGLRINRLRKKV